jgi:hypothetical protein
MQSLAAAGLQPRLQAEGVEHRRTSVAASWMCSQVVPFARVEVEDHPVGLVDGLGHRIPRVELDHVHLRGAGQRLGLPTSSSDAWPGHRLRAVR